MKILRQQKQQFSDFSNDTEKFKEEERSWLDMKKKTRTIQLDD